MADERDQDAWLIDASTGHNNWAQAKSDMATATTLHDAGIYYAAVFFAQQAAEKSLRAACVLRLHKNPRGHNIIQSANSLQAPLEIMNAAAELNADFLTSRSVESAEGVPAHMYNRESSQAHLDAAKAIQDWIKDLI
jgi:HEPN domain-containing protein